MPDLNTLQDPPADRLIKQVFGSGKLEALNQTLAAVTRNHQVRGLLEDPLFEGAFPDQRQSVFLPEWADSEKLRLGEELFSKYGPSAYIILASASLPATFASESIAAALMATGQLDDEVPKRLRETSQMVLSVTAEGSFEDEGAGIALTLRVRLLHATIRFLIERGTDPGGTEDHRMAAFRELTWDAERLGKPIHQDSLMLTLLSFSYVVLRGLRELGIVVSAEEADAYIHTWNVVGFIIGVEGPELNDWPNTYQEAGELFERLLREQLPGADGAATNSQSLVRALNGYLDDLLIFGTRSVPEILTRRILGPEIAEQLGAERHLFFGLLGRVVLVLIQFVNWLRQWVGVFVPFAGRLWGVLGRQIIEDLSLLPGHERAQVFVLPWKLDRERAENRQKRRQKRRTKRVGTA